MSLLLNEQCCCECFYRIPLCRCENDPEVTCPLYIPCFIADTFFAANPQYKGHLVFAVFEPNVPDERLCYDLQPTAEFTVNVVPPGACLLEEIPPPFPENACAACCPQCCAPCKSGPLPGCSPPTCCYNRGDPATFTVQYPAITTTEICINDGQVVTTTCPAGFWQAQYEVLDCVGHEVVFGFVSGDDCLAPVLIMNCCPQPGGQQCLCPIPGSEPSCTCLCQIVDPCAIACPQNGTSCCLPCFSLGGICCFLPPGPSPIPDLDDPCYALPSPDVELNCSTYQRRVGIPYTRTSAVRCDQSCGGVPPGAPEPGHECACRVTTFTFNAQPSCVYNQAENVCQPP
jgi:hypothetical protein